MNKITTVAAVLLIGTVVGAPAALAQTTTAPNSGAGLPGLPGNKSGPPARPGDQFNIRLDQSNVPGLPGNKSGPALQPPTGLQNRAQGNEEEDEDQGGSRENPLLRPDKRAEVCLLRCLASNRQQNFACGPKCPCPI